MAPGAAAEAAARLFLATRRHPLPERERVVLARARREALPSADGALPVWVWGADGPPVFLVHGWEGRGAQLGAFVEPLVAAGHRVVAWDAPGHGEAPGRSSSLVALARALEAAVGRFGPGAGLVAHSAGAVAATYAFARALPVERAVYVAPGADLVAYSRLFARRLGLPESFRRRVQVRVERRIGVAWSELEPLALAAAIDRPLLVLSDRGDREAPLSSVEALAARWPEARLVVTEGLGHRRILRDPEVVDAATRFLTGEAKAPADRLALSVGAEIGR